MNEKTLDSLLQIAIEGPPISEFPVSEAVKLWATKKNRLLCYHYYLYIYYDTLYTMCIVLALLSVYYLT